MLLQNAGSARRVRKELLARRTQIVVSRDTYGTVDADSLADDIPVTVPIWLVLGLRVSLGHCRRRARIQDLALDEVAEETRLLFGKRYSVRPRDFDPRADPLRNKEAVTRNSGFPERLPPTLVAMMVMVGVRGRVAVGALAFACRGGQRRQRAQVSDLRLDGEKGGRRWRPCRARACRFPQPAGQSIRGAPRRGDGGLLPRLQDLNA